MKAHPQAFRLGSLFYTQVIGVDEPILALLFYNSLFDCGSLVFSPGFYSRFVLVSVRGRKEKRGSGNVCERTLEEKHTVTSISSATPSSPLSHSVTFAIMESSATIYWIVNVWRVKREEREEEVLT
jgi:hypothetical protein